MAETESSAPSALLNRENPYIQSLQEAGFRMREVKKPGDRFNAVVYQQEGGADIEGKKSNLLMLYAVQGESGGNSHVNASFLSELKPRVDTVMGFNSALSQTSLEAAKYEHDLEKQSDEIVALYEEEIPEDKRDQPIILVGHSLGGTTAPIVARKLLEKGFNVNNVIMVAPPLSERTSKRMLKDFAKLGDKRHFHPDIPILYPSPMDIAEFTDRLSELSQKSYLNPEEQEEKAAYELAIQRTGEPDKLLLDTMTLDDRKAVEKMDEEILYWLQSTVARDEIPLPVGERGKERIALLQEKRRKLLAKSAKKVLNGKITNKRTQHSATGRGLMKMIGHASRSFGEIKKTVADLAAETTVDVTQVLIDYNNTISDHALDITLLAGSTDPIPGDYEVGQVNKMHVGSHTRLSEIKMTNFDHFTIGDDPVRVAQAVYRLTKS